MLLDKRQIVESTIDSIARGIIRIEKINITSEMLVHNCQYYLELLEKIEDDKKWDMEKIDHRINEIMIFLIECRIFNYISGVTQEISQTEPMHYCLNKKLILQRG